MQANTADFHQLVTDLRQLKENVHNVRDSVSAISARVDSTEKQVASHVKLQTWFCGVLLTLFIFACGAAIPLLWGMSADIAVMKRGMDSGIDPPQWFLNDYGEVKTRIKELEKGK